VTCGQLRRKAAATNHAGPRWPWRFSCTGLLQGIGAMAASLGGVECVALTGGIGENDTMIRSELARTAGLVEPFALVVVSRRRGGMINRLCRRANSDQQVRGLIAAGD